MEYTATLDWKSKIITAIFTMVFGGLLFLITSQINIGPFSYLETFLIIGFDIFILSIYVGIYLYRPLKYIIYDDRIVVKRPHKDVVILISQIKDAFIVRHESMQMTERIGGNGGIFGYFGDFKNGFGIMKWYATKTDNYIMIQTFDNDNIVLTPDDVNMIKEIKKLIAK